MQSRPGKVKVFTMEEGQDEVPYERVKVTVFGEEVTDDTPQYWFYKVGTLVDHVSKKNEVSHIIFQFTYIIL